MKKLQVLLERAKLILRQKGLIFTISAGVRYIVFQLLNHILVLYYNLFHKKSFIFQGKSYCYFHHPYNCTYKNERMVEVPIIYEMVKKAEACGQEVLEVGNVLSHYFHLNHDIIDKYEKAEGVINEDVVDFQPSKRYDMIISISTLEHVGWDEYPKDPTKVLRVIQNLKTCLSNNGKMVVTLPLGYNPHIDSYIKNNVIHFDQIFLLKKIIRCEWTEVKFEKSDIGSIKYDFHIPSANGLIIGIIRKNLNKQKF